MSTNLFSIMSGWEALEIKGPDAKDFLQRLTTADFRFMQPGSFTPNTLLLPTGKVVLYFKTIFIEANHYLLLVPTDESGASPSQKAYDEFEKMHFRENLTLTPLKTTLSYLRVLGSDESLLDGELQSLARAKTGAAIRLENDTLFALNENRWSMSPVQFDLGLAAPTSALAALKTTRLKHFTETKTLEGYRIRAGDPAVPAEISHKIIPLEAQLDDAVHENKGCYPGQEVVERIRSMGQAPRKIAMFQGTSALPQVPTSVTTTSDDATQEVGTLTSAVADPFGSGWVGLGFIKRVFAKPEIQYAVTKEAVSVRFK
jgi:folate-binding protein YgfZ